MALAEKEPLDLSFAPVTTSNPQRLSAADIVQYNREGYVQPFDIYTENEVTALRAYADRLMTDMGAGGGYGINCYQARLAGLWDIATEPRILDHVEDILGPNIVCWASAILSKAPHDPKAVPWHQDASFWSLSPARTVTVWLAIDDADAANSAMRFIPRTHDKGALKVRKAEGASVFHIETDGADALGEPVTNALKAGQISLHADMLVHGSLPNTSDRRRCGLTLRYCPPEVRITDEGWARGVEAIVARGTDPTGRWRHHARPTNDDITATSSPHVVGNN
ncbi:MAG: phytanoyl-CoA dioxygenase family protein [Pseudomonadota bacterium]